MSAHPRLRRQGLAVDEPAIRRGVVDAVRWVRAMNFRNVVVEIANEYGHRGFVHDILRTAQGQVALIELARREAPGLLISTSGGGHGRLDPEVADASDFLLIHFNLTPIEQIPARVAALARYGKPIVCNEDDKVGPVGSRAARISVQNGASWGFMDNEKNQYWPFEFEGSADDRVVYRTILQLTTPR